MRGMPPGEGHWNWKGEDAGLEAIHTRLRKERGAARTHPCADCGRRAWDWAFDEPTGYSADLSRYRPLCRRCHMADDGRAQVRYRDPLTGRFA